MAGATDLERMAGYAKAFELAYLSGAWNVLEPHFAEDARHVVHDGGRLGLDDRGRDAVIGGLRGSVEALDRRFDLRIPEIVDGPCTRPGGVWMRFRLALRRAGAPDLVFEGDHLTRYENGRIALLEERLLPGVAESIDRYFEAHETALRPAGSPLVLPSEGASRDAVEGAVARSLVRAYGQAKSEQDAGAALAVCSDDFVLETVPFDLRTRDRKEAETQLGLFFAAFPDYGVTLDGMATGSGAVVCWGRARMTWKGPFGRLAPTGRRADLPFVSVFPYGGGALRGERFYFDRAALSEQIGLPLPAMEETLRLLRAASGGGVSSAAPVGGAAR